MFPFGRANEGQRHVDILIAFAFVPRRQSNRADAHLEENGRVNKLMVR
jgi:hypothetical protein